MDFDPKDDDRWVYQVSGYDKQKNELIFVRAGNPVTAALVKRLFQKEGMTNVQSRNLADAESSKK